MAKILILLGVIAGVIGLDQLTKALAVIYLEGEPSFPIWQDVLHLTYVRNEGAAFGILSNHRWVFMIFSTIAIFALGVYLFRFSKEKFWAKIAIAMIIGGGIGNMIDRIVLGSVVDFIDFTLIHFAVFNVADSFVCVGVGLLVLYLILSQVEEARKNKEKQMDASVSATDAAELPLSPDASDDVNGEASGEEQKDDRTDPE